MEENPFPSASPPANHSVNLSYSNWPIAFHCLWIEGGLKGKKNKVRIELETVDCSALGSTVCHSHHHRIIRKMESGGGDEETIHHRHTHTRIVLYFIDFVFILWQSLCDQKGIYDHLTLLLYSTFFRVFGFYFFWKNKGTNRKQC